MWNSKVRLGFLPVILVSIVLLGGCTENDGYSSVSAAGIGQVYTLLDMGENRYGKTIDLVSMMLNDTSATTYQLSSTDKAAIFTEVARSQ